MFEVNPELNFSKKRPNIKTSLGAILSATSIILLVIIFCFELKSMIERSKKEFQQADYTYDLYHTGEIEIKNYNDTFNFVIGVRNSDYEFDIMDNRYIEI